MKLRLLTAAAVVLAACGVSGAARYAALETGYAHGAWATTKAGDTVAFYADDMQGACVGFQSAGRKGDERFYKSGFDFAIAAQKDGVVMQIVDEKGDVHTIPATALLKLKDMK